MWWSSRRTNPSIALITFQNYFRLYEKLAGMTGTALTEAEEFNKIYKLDVVVIPTNKPINRVDHLPELLPPLREARRHDRHCAHRGRGIQQDLQAGCGGHPDEQTHQSR